MQPLVILGAGGHAREILDVVEAINHQEPTYEVLGFLDDTGGDQEVLSRRAVGVMGPTGSLRELAGSMYAIGIGAASARRHFDLLATAWGKEAATLIHPEATVGSDCVLAPGCVLAAGARLSTNVRLGRHTHLNLNSSVSHDCRLGDYVTLSPGSHVSGWSNVGGGVTLGTGAVTKDRIVVGEGSLVGAGAVVVGDVPAFAIAKGVPARATGTVPQEAPGP